MAEPPGPFESLDDYLATVTFVHEAIWELRAAAGLSPLRRDAKLLCAGAQLLGGERRLLEPLLHELDDPLVLFCDLRPWTNRCHELSVWVAPAETPTRSQRL